MRARFAVGALGRLTLGLLVASAAPALAQHAGRPAAAAGTPRATAPATAVPREGIEALEAQLDRAIDRVSLPRPAALLGREAARGYRLPGYGIVFVLTPRTLPGPDGYDVLRPRRHVELHRVQPRSAGVEPPDDVGALERQVIVLQHETEQARSAAEQDMERIVQDVRVRVAAPAPPAPAAPVVPAAAPPAAPEAPVAAEAPAFPVPAEAPLPPSPPWRFWFGEAVPRDPRTPDALVADVRRVLVEALESGPGRVPGLRPEEFVTVAVDFEAAGMFAQRARPERTLVVRARVRDLEARSRGVIPADELRRRVEVVEY